MSKPRLGAFLAISVLAAAASTARAADARRPGGWGTAHETLLHLSPFEFHPVISTESFDVSVDPTLFGVTTSQTGGPLHLFAVPRIPAGALLTSVRLRYCDADPAENVAVFLFWSDGDHFGAGRTPIAGLSSDDGPSGCDSISADLAALEYVVNPGARQFFFEVDVMKGTVLLGAEIGYRLQVSPAPATPTFGDVPTDYLYYRAIEALAASGITSGCGLGNFCPNQAVTRGEMAKFLANALGLYFPN